MTLLRQEIGAAEFKARCLEIVDHVERFGGEIIITKHRKPVARLVPISSTKKRFCGSLKGLVLDERDILSPTGERWQADEEHFAMERSWLRAIKR